ncbi:hypothetical protein [Streptomyces sp. NPDC086519]|uniref:hypothetical protein n=1 Tax=Streptomyces sp. NPDC086519 TaxID=3154863 RepID=UPI003430E563
MFFIGELRGVGLTVAEIRELTTARADGAGPEVGSHLAELLGRPRDGLRLRVPLWGSIAAEQQTLERIEKFEAEHQTGLTQGDLCWAGDARGGCEMRARRSW